MQQFLYRIQPTHLAMLSEGATEAEAESVGRHFAYLQVLLQRGTLLLAGRTSNSDASSFGIVFFVADSEDEARAIILDDPAVREGVMRAELFPYRVVLWSEVGL